MANRIPAYHDSNHAMYVANATGNNEIKWKKCGAPRNFHIISWNPGFGDEEPKHCQHCAAKKCQCDSTSLLAFGCQCGGN